jgi:hypothetical protein
MNLIDVLICNHFPFSIASISTIMPALALQLFLQTLPISYLLSFILSFCVLLYAAKERSHKFISLGLFTNWLALRLCQKRNQGEVRKQEINRSLIILTPTEAGGTYSTVVVHILFPEVHILFPEVETREHLSKGCSPSLWRVQN